jgi:hypothetical protein
MYKHIFKRILVKNIIPRQFPRFQTRSLSKNCLFCPSLYFNANPCFPFYAPIHLQYLSQFETLHCILGSVVENMLYFVGKSYFADLRMTFRQKYFLQDWFGNKLGVGLD